MDNPQKGKKRKLPRTAHNKMQFLRTARNKVKARAHHAKLNPTINRHKQIGLCIQSGTGMKTRRR